MKHALSAHDPDRRRLLVGDAAGITRLIAHLFTHWTLPRVEIRIDSLPPVVVQRAQHRIEQLSEACNCVLGATLAATTLLAGMIMGWSSIHSLLWTAMQFWQYMGLLAVLALHAWLLGKGIEVFLARWTRTKLMLVLRGVRHQLGN